MQSADAEVFEKVASRSFLSGLFNNIDLTLIRHIDCWHWSWLSWWCWWGSAVEAVGQALLPLLHNIEDQTWFNLEQLLQWKHESNRKKSRISKVEECLACASSQLHSPWRNINLVAQVLPGLLPGWESSLIQTELLQCFDHLFIKSESTINVRKIIAKASECILSVELAAHWLFFFFSKWHTFCHTLWEGGVVFLAKAIFKPDQFLAGGKGSYFWQVAWVITWQGTAGRGWGCSLPPTDFSQAPFKSSLSLLQPLIYFHH